MPENTYQAYLDTDKQLSGWFETAEPLAAGLEGLNILELVESTEDEPGNANAIVAYEFQDGEFIYKQDNSGLALASISTDETGKLTKAELVVMATSEPLTGGAFSGDINAIYVTSSGVLAVNITNYIMGTVGVASLPEGVEESNIKAFAARAHAECVDATEGTDTTPATEASCTFTNKGAAYVAGSDVQINADVLVVTVPGTPTALQATAGNAQATLAWTLPLNDGGAAISNYEYSLNNGTTWITFDPAITTSPATITGLTNGTTYQIKLRALNSVGAGLASEMVSVRPVAPVIITEPEPIIDDDGDGVDDVVEANVPPPLAGGLLGDGNGDGIIDTEQNNVTSIVFRNTDKPSTNPNAPKVFVTLVANETAGLQNGAIITAVSQEDAPSNKPDNIDMPLGLISFRAETTVGEAQLFSLWVDSSIAINGYFKQNTMGQWVNIASQIVAVGSKNRIDFVIKDGGEFDSDGEVNGVIVDPGALGFFTELSIPTPEPTPEPTPVVKHTLSLSVEPTQAGQIEADKRFLQGSRAVVRAIANPGYAFIGWQENGRQVSDAAAYSFTVNNDRKLQALFSATPANELGINLGSRGKADLMAVDTVSGDIHYGSLNGQELAEHGILGTLPQGWRLQGNGIIAGRSAVLLRHDLDETVFLADISHFVVNNVVALGALSQEVSLLHFADFNGDGYWDGLLLNTLSRELTVVLMNGYNPVETVSLGMLGATETVQLVADFNGDKQAAIILRDHDSGDFFLLDELASGGKRTLLGRLSLDWQLLGHGRFNRDDQADLLLRHSVSGMVNVLYMDATTRQSGSAEIPVPLDWRLASLGDFTGDGLTDLVWQHTFNRQLALTTTQVNDLSDFAPLFELPENLELIAK